MNFIEELYIVLPTINGEIDGYPVLYKCFDDMLHMNSYKEYIIYCINLEDCTIFELEDLVI